MLRHALVHSVIMAVLCGALMPWFHHRLGALSAALQWAVTIPALLGLAGVGTALATGLIGVVEQRAVGSFWPSFAFSFPINALLTMTLGVGMTLYEVQRGRLDAVTMELRTRELEHERARKMALEARLASLESRLQPHFLFNTLNAISALIQEDPDRAERMVERLAALLRFSLDATGRGLVPLADELKIVTRLPGDRADAAGRAAGASPSTCRPTSRRCEVPPLAVQTLVENSVKHAVAPRPSGGRDPRRRRGDRRRLRSPCGTTAPGFTADAMQTGHGLENLQGAAAARATARRRP